MVSKLLRHSDQDERETDGAVHWDTIRAKLLRGFREDGAEELQSASGLIISSKEATKDDSSIAKLLRNL